MSKAHDLFDNFLDHVLANRWNAHILQAVKHLKLSDWWLTAGCVAQSVWNAKHGRPPEQGILDYDVFYYDPDISWEAEDAVIGSAAEIFAQIPVEVQIRNQARVPLWYKQKFGVDYPPVKCAADGIDRFPCRTMSVGVRREADAIFVHAPYGIVDLMAGRLVPNTVLDIPGVYAEKTNRWLREWPSLTVVAWPDRVDAPMWNAAPSEPDLSFIVGCR